MTPENASREPRTSSVSAQSSPHGRKATSLAPDHEAIARDYAAYLDLSTLKQNSQKTYISAVRGYLRWLESAYVSGDPLDDARRRDEAVREYSAWLKDGARRSLVTLNKTMAAIDNFYVWRGLGACGISRADIPLRVSRTLNTQELRRYMKSALNLVSARNRAISLTPLCTGARISDLAALNVSDIDITRVDNMLQGTISVAASRRNSRVIPIHQNLLLPVVALLTPRAAQSQPDLPALFVSGRGARMSTDSLSDVIRAVAEAAGLDGVTPNVLRHTFEASLSEQGTASATVAYLLGHTRHRGTHGKPAPSDVDVSRAIAGLPVLDEQSQPVGPSAVDPAARLTAYQNQIDLIERMAARDPADPGRRSQLAEIYMQIGHLVLTTGDADAARVAYLTSFNIFGQIASDHPDHPDNPDWRLKMQAAAEQLRGLLPK